jgi:hypothetical protein
LATVFRIGCFCAFLQGNRPLLFCGTNGFAKRSLNFGLVCTDGRKQYTPEPVQFSTPPALSESFDPSFGLRYSLKSFVSAIRELQSFGL